MGKAPYSEKARALFDELEQDEADRMMVALQDEGSYRFDESVELDDGSTVTGVRPVPGYRPSETDVEYGLWESITEQVEMLYEGLCDRLC